MSQDRRGVAAAHLARELDLHYATAEPMLHKLHRALASPGEHPLKGVVEVDETYCGSKGCSSSVGKRHRSWSQQEIYACISG